MTVPPRKETISSRVLADLRGAILRADLSPGAKINLDHLRHRFDTSISPLREALARLTADGLVVFEDQRGFRVATVSRVELDDLYALRADLEVMARRHGLGKWRDPRSASSAPHFGNRQPRRLASCAPGVAPRPDCRGDAPAAAANLRRAGRPLPPLPRVGRPRGGWSGWA
jgi:hypothetical protein